MFAPLATILLIVKITQSTNEGYYSDTDTDNNPSDSDYYDAYDVENADKEMEQINDDVLSYSDEEFMSMMHGEVHESESEEGESIEIKLEDIEKPAEIELIMEIYDDDTFEEYPSKWNNRNESNGTTSSGETTGTTKGIYYGNETNYNDMETYKNYTYKRFAPFIMCKFLPASDVVCGPIAFENEDDYDVDDKSGPDSSDAKSNVIDYYDEWHEYREEENIADTRKKYYLRKQNKAKANSIRCSQNITGVRHSEIVQTAFQCKVLDGIPCSGNKTFYRCTPCVFYTGHYYTHTLMYSVLLGFLGVDRFCLGYRTTAVMKALSLGGLGIWWIYDIILLITNQLLPADGSRWNIYR